MANFKGFNNKQQIDVYIDTGNHTTVGRANGNNVVIPTLVSQSNDRMYQGAFLVEDFQGCSYVVGDENQTTNTNIKLSKMDLAHQLTSYVAIHHLVPNNAEVRVYVGLPIKSFYNVEYRKEFEEFIKKDELILTVNGVKKTIYMNSVQALPEGVGYVFTHPTSSLIGVVDIGHLTVDCAIYRDCTPLLETVFTDVNGARALKTMIRDELNTKLLLNIQDYQMDEIMVQGLYGGKREQAKPIIYDCKIKFLKNLAKLMIEHQWELETTQIIFSGGGSMLLHDVINEFENFELSDEPLFDNINGFEELGVLICD